MNIKIDLVETQAIQQTVRALVPSEDVRKEMDKAYRALGRQVKIPGFRPGKVPRKVLEGRYKGAVEDEVAEDLLRSIVHEAVEHHGVEAIALTHQEVPPLDGADWTVELTFEIRPKIESVTLDGLKAERPEPALKEEQVEEALEEQRRHATRIEDTEEDSTVGEGLIADAKAVLRDGEEELDLGSLLVDIDAPGQFSFLVEPLTGAKVGDSIEAEDLSIGEEFWQEPWRGKTVTASLELEGIKRYVVPTLDELATDLGKDSAQTLRDEVEAKLTKEMKNKADAVLRTNIIKALIEANPVELGGHMVENRAQDNLDQLLGRMAGYSPERPSMNLKDLGEETRANFLERAEYDLRRALLLEAIAKQESIVINDEKREERIEEMAKEMAMPVEHLQPLMKEGGPLEQELLEQTVLDMLLGRSEVVAIPWPEDEQEPESSDDDAEANEEKE